MSMFLWLRYTRVERERERKPERGAVDGDGKI